MLLGGREDIDDAAADGNLAAGRDQVGPGVADLDQPGHQAIELAILTLAEADRFEVTEAAHDRLQQAPRRRHDHRERPVRLAGPAG